MQKVKQKELHFHILVTCISLYYTFLSAYSFVPINQVDLPQALLYKSPPDSTLPLNPTTPFYSYFGFRPFHAWLTYKT